MKSKTKELMLLAKLGALTDKQASAKAPVAAGQLSAVPGGEGVPLPTATVREGLPLPTATQKPLPVATATPGSALEILKAAKAVEMPVPSAKPVESNPVPTVKGYSPVQDYLKKRKK